MVLLLVLCSVAGCGGSKGPSANDRAFLALASGASIKVGQAIAELNACTDQACLQQHAGAARAAIDSQIAGVQSALPDVKDGCIRGVGDAFLTALRADRATISPAGLANDDAALALDDRARELSAQAGQKTAACLHTPAERLALSNAVFAFSGELGHLTRCTGQACFAVESRRFDELVDKQQPKVDESLDGGPKCVRPARTPVDSAFAAGKRLAADLARNDPEGATNEAVKAEGLFTDASRVVQRCLT